MPRGDGAVEALRAVPPDAWAPIVALATEQGVAPLVYRRLSQPDLRPVVPPDVLQRLAAVYAHNALRNGALLEELDDVRRILSARGIPTLPLKGAHLARAVYADPALRPMVDLDVLVPAAQADEAWTVLTGSGFDPMQFDLDLPDYTTHQHRHPLKSPNGVRVELHTGVVELASPYAVDLEAIWNRALRREPRALAVEDLLLHLCTHIACNHRFQVPLLWLRDVAEVLVRAHPVLDWSLIGRVAAQDGRSRLVGAVLSLSASTFSMALPDAARSAVGVPPPDAAIVRCAWEAMLGDPGGYPVALRAMRDAPTVRAKLVALWTNLFPPRERLRRMYGLPPGSRPGSWYYLRRPVDIVRRRGALLLGRGRRGTTWGQVSAGEANRRAIDDWLKRDAGTDRHPQSEDTV